MKMLISSSLFFLEHTLKTDMQRSFHKTVLMDREEMHSEPVSMCQSVSTSVVAINNTQESQ